MFEEMVSQLKQGKIPQPDLLRKRFDRALIKKLAVIKTPPSFWTADKKINPASKELLWAAILLGDSDSFLLVEGIIATELSEKQRFSSRSPDMQSVNKLTGNIINDLLDLAPSEEFRQFLKKKIEVIGRR